MKLCKYSYSLPINDHFCAILRANFGQKYKQKLCIFALLGHILGKIQLHVVPKENLFEILTLDIFKLYMSNKVDRLVQACSKFIFKCFIPQILQNGTMGVV